MKKCKLTKIGSGRGRQVIVDGLGPVHKNVPETAHHNFGIPQERWRSHFSSSITCGQSQALDGAAHFKEYQTWSHSQLLRKTVKR